MDFKDLDDISTASADNGTAADTDTTKIKNKDGAPQNYNSNSDSEEEQEYVSAYSKFANKNLSNTTTTSTTTKQPARRRRGGYGTNNTTSMLETLPENNDGAPDTSSNFDDLNNNNETTQPPSNSNNNVGLPKDDDFGLNMNDFMSQDFGGVVGTQQTDIFMNSDNDEDDDDDDDATRPLDSNEMSDLEKIGPWTGDIESDVDTAATTTSDSNEGEEMLLEEDVKPKGRTKQTKKKKSVLESDTLGIESEVKDNLGEESPQEEDNTEGSMMEVDKSEIEGAPSDELVVESNMDAPSQEEEQSPKKPSGSSADPSNSDLLSLVDTLFTAADKDTMTVGGVNRSVATHFGWKKVDKTRKKVIKNRLMDLINGIVSVGEGLDDEETKKKKKKKSSQKKKQKKSKTKSDDENMEENADDVGFEGDYESEEEPEPLDADKSSDYEEEAPTPKKRSGKKNKKKVSYSSDSDDSIDAPTKKKKRERRASSKKSGKGKMAKHLRDHHSKARQRQIEEARIRKEELGHLADDDDEANLAKKDKVSEEDRQRHAEIQARFNTTSEELLIKRREDRVGLIDRLRMARLEQLEENLTLSEMAKNVKKEEVNVDVKVEHGQPKLTSTNIKAEEKEEEEEEAVNAAAPKKSKMLTLGDDTSSEEESEDDDDDLEIVAPSASKPSDEVDTSKNDIKSQVKAKNISAMDFLFNPGKKVASKASKPVANPRVALRNALRAQKMYASNRWLATQLGLRDEDKHIKDCLEAVTQKNKHILMMEKKAVAREKEAALRSELAFAEDTPMDESNDTEKEFDEDEEEDEEMAVARELEQLENGADVEQDGSDENSQTADPSKEQTGETDESQADKPSMDSEVNAPDTDPATDDVEPAEMEESSEDAESSMVVTPAKVNTDVVTSENADDEKSATEMVASEDKDASEETSVSLESNKADENSTEMEGEELKEKDVAAYVDTKSSSDDKDAIEEASPAEEESEGEEEAAAKKPKKPKNSAWQAMLLKEKASIAKEKKRQRKNGGLVEGEAEEEEEEEGIVGLEDFGFAVSTKKDDEEDVDAEIDEDDLEHVVDDLSDGEGDEEAGEMARKRLQKKEEKEQHQEMIRRMRDGFDGRRGGIATSAGARGTLRFDQLVAADGREGAKKLGLLNDDELDSDDEDGEKKDNKDDDEEEDETAMLDQMIRERHLGKQDEALEENFTDEEESDDEDEEEEKNTKGADDDDADDRVQDRLAKHFDKRARRNRMLEEYGKEEEDETKRLYEEDNFCLKTVKTSFSHSRSVETSNLGSNLGVAKENNFASKKRKTSDKTTDDAKPATSFLAQGGSLSIALMASRSIARKRKATTTFKSGKQVKGFSRSNSSSSSSRSVSLNHVVFMSESSSQAFDSNSRSHSFMGTSAKSAPKSKASRGSLWSRINKK